MQLGALTCLLIGCLPARASAWGFAAAGSRGRALAALAAAAPVALSARVCFVPAPCTACRSVILTREEGWSQGSREQRALGTAGPRAASLPRLHTPPLRRLAPLRGGAAAGSRMVRTPKTTLRLPGALIRARRFELVTLRVARRACADLRRVALLSPQIARES